ncbi:stage III sporulation protein AB [Desulfitobacterium sp.]|uniref:stage III sporulation protein AB n=1 Tax=Desulfitobacterium sp. TaxID=49981 RepID=UPI002B8B581E|nr:stage III sporulation protein AB [Desulfitobacterium sp.]HVJ48907.1 stage III sporulation protein AB [Desulfitobacterium sp.]
MIVLASLILILGCGSLGLYLAARIKKRPVELRDCLTALTLLDTEIIWGGTPLPEAFALLKQRTEGAWKGFFAELERRVQEGESANSAWSQTIQTEAKKFCLKPEDWQVIQNVGKGLGRSDRQEQHKQIELVKQQIRDVQEQALVSSDKQAKMWSYLGFLCGIAGVIFLI